MTSLYPEIEPFNHFFLKTDSPHQVYVEQCGNPQGIPVVFLHGGPCSGCRPEHRRFFNPELYHIILLDQRGSGRSLPFGETRNNTTQDLINDLEQIRQQLKISQWLLFGGSWGAALALLYAQQYPEQVSAMILRGVFLARQKDLDWFIDEGAGRIYPEYWQNLLHSMPQEPLKHGLLEALTHSIFAADEVTRKRITRAWMMWSGQTALGPYYDPAREPEHISEKMVKQVQMEMHYAKNRYFIAENQILENCPTIQHIPCMIIHGRMDLVCPTEAGFSLSKALPDADFSILPTAGHVAAGNEMISALVDATDKMHPKIQTG